MYVKGARTRGFGQIESPAPDGIVTSVAQRGHKDRKLPMDGITDQEPERHVAETANMLSLPQD